MFHYACLRRWVGTILTTPLRGIMIEPNQTPVIADFNFTQHYIASYRPKGSKYSDYDFAYRFGFELAMHLRYEDEGWLVVETNARKQWKQQHPGKEWIEYRDAVRCAWQMVNRARTRVTN